MQTQTATEQVPFSRAQWLNKNCPCTSLERELLPKLEAAGLLFSQTPVFLSQDEFVQIEKQIESLEQLLNCPPLKSRY